MKVGRTRPIEWLRASLWVNLFVMLAGFHLPAAVMAQAPAVDHSATQILTQLRSSVVKVITISKTSGSETGNGTGFIAGSDSLVVSNYHVVSKLALQPKQFELEYLADDGSRGKLQLVALDVANDLVLLRLEKPISGGRPIKLSARKLQKGDTVFSIGFPMNKGLTIVSGTNNGKAEDSYQGRLHYSGALNPGMSGGPAIDGDGALVGVNVARAHEAQLVSLLVDAEKVDLLLRQMPAKDTSIVDYWRLEVGNQLRKHAEALALPLINKRLPSRKFDTYTSVDFEPLGYKCAGVRTDPKGKYQHELDGRVCLSNSDIYVDGETYSGSVNLYTAIRTNRGMSALRFANVRETNFAHKMELKTEPTKNKTGYKCVERLLKVNNLRAKTFACLRRDDRFEDLYDTVFIMHSVESDVQSIQVRVEMEGLTYAGSQAILKRVTEGVSWNQ